MRRIGLSQRVDFLQDRDERRDCLDQAWGRLLGTLGLLPVALPNAGPAAEVMIEQLKLDGLILTGGNDLCSVPAASDPAPERDAFETAALQYCVRHGIPVLGVCRGLQIMVQLWGGQLRPVDGHVRTRHEILPAADVETALFHREEANSFHAYGVVPADVGPELQPAAYAPDGTVEAVRHIRLPQWAVMWHPERQSHAADRQLIAALFSRR